mgnify:FL=1|tara:strand:- start:1909 stop:2091 length:183 start_codon:yes stop_codon:yes gene_type:complete
MPNIKLDKTKAMKILNNYFMTGGGVSSPEKSKKIIPTTSVILKPDWCEMSTDPNCIPSPK